MIKIPARHVCRDDRFQIVIQTITILLVIGAAGSAHEQFIRVPLKSRITHVQPMTGIVLWTTSEHNRTDAVQLEYSYMKYGDVVKQRGEYNWIVMDRLLETSPTGGTRRSFAFTSSIQGTKDRPCVHQEPSRLSRGSQPERG